MVSWIQSCGQPQWTPRGICSVRDIPPSETIGGSSVTSADRFIVASTEHRQRHALANLTGAKLCASFPNRHHRLSMGDEVRLVGPANIVLEQAVFIGSQDGEAFFHRRKVDEIIGCPLDSLRLMDNKGVRIGAFEAESIPSIPQQGDGSCAVHSMIHCLDWLAEARLLTHPDLMPALVGNREKLFALFARYLHGEKREARIQQDPRYHPERGMLHHLKYFLLHAPPSQAAMRGMILEHFQIPHTTCSSVRQLVRHVCAGRPAIVDVHVIFDRLTITHPIDGRPSSHRYTTFPATRNASEGGHSVCVIGYYKTGWRKGHFIVLDSGFGGFSIWSEHALRKTPIFATLVMPRRSR